MIRGIIDGIIDRKNYLLSLIICSLIILIKCPAPDMKPSGKYLSTGKKLRYLGMFQLASFSNYLTLTITLGAYPKSLPSYTVALSMSTLRL